MHVRPLGIHVENAIVGAVIDHAGARPPLATPHPAIGRSGPGLGLTQGALIGPAGETVGVADAAVDAARLDRNTVGRQIVEPLAKARIDVFLQHIGARVDMGVGVVDAKAFLHRFLPWSAPTFRIITPWLR